MSVPRSSTTDANTFDDKGGSQYNQPGHDLVVDAEKNSTGAPNTAPASVPDRAKTADAAAGTAASAPIVDRGFRAWGTAAGCFLAFFATLGYVTGYGPYQDYYESIFPERSPDDISWIGSIMLCFAYLFAIPAAILNDKLGPQVVLAIGSFFIVFGVMMSSLAREYYQVLLSHGVCVGIGLGICFLPVISLPNQHFARYRGVVVSLAVGGSSIGGVLWAIIFNQMINYDRVSYGWTQRTIGFIQLFCLVLAVLLVRSNVPRNRGVRLGMFPFVQALRNLQLSAFLVATLLSFAGLYVPYFYVTPYARALGASAQTAFYVSSVLNALTFIGRFLFGWASDRVGHSNTLVLCTGLSGVLVFAWSGVSSMAGLWVWSAFYGLLSGPAVSLQTPALVLNTPGEGMAKLRVLPTYIAVICTIASFGALGGNPIAGRLLANDTGDLKEVPTRQDYRGMMWFSGAILLISAALYAYARLSVTRKLKA